MDLLKKLIVYLKSNFLFTKIVNPGEIADPIVKAIRDKEYETVNPQDISTPIVSALYAVKNAVESKEITEQVEVTNFPDLTPQIANLGAIIKEEVAKLDKEVVVKNDLSQLLGLFRSNQDKKTIVSALQSIEKKIPTVTENPDYTLLLDEVITNLERIQSTDLSKIEKQLSQYFSQAFQFPENLVDDDRVKVTLSDGQLRQIGGGIAFPGNIRINNTQAKEINPSTEEKQDDIITAITNGIVIKDVSDNLLSLEDNAFVPVSINKDAIGIGPKLILSKTVELTSSGNVHIPTNGTACRIHNLKFSLSEDMTDIAFRWESTGDDFSKFLSPKAGGYYGTNLHPNYIKGITDAVLYCNITGTGTVQINLEYTEI